MQYILAENRQIIHLGPIHWRYRIIQSELNELEVAFTLPQIEQGYIKISDTLEIFPITQENIPIYDTSFEILSGPFYNYAEKSVELYYNVSALDLTAIKQNLKQRVSTERYRKEISGTSIKINGVEIKLDTTREGRIKYSSMMYAGANSINYKYNNEFILLTTADVENIINSINEHIQKQFNWEKNMFDTIDSSTIDDLKVLQIEETKSIVGVP